MDKKRQLRADMIREIRQNMQEVNRRVQEYKDEIKERNLRESDFLKTQYTLFRDLTNTKSKNRIATGNLSRMNKRDLGLLLQQQERFLKSPWSTKEGRHNIDIQRRATLRRKGWELTEDQYDAYVAMVTSDTAEKLRYLGTFSSNQMLTYVQDDESKFAQMFRDALDEIVLNLDFEKMSESEIHSVFEDIFYGELKTARESEIYKKYVKEGK